MTQIHSLTQSDRFSLTLAQPHDHRAVDELRLLAYSGAGYFKLKDTHHLRCEADPVGSYILCAWQGPLLVGTVRLTPAFDLLTAGDILGFAAPRPVSLPAAIFSRGAVHPTAQGLGWMPFLLTAGVHLADELGFQCALGAQASGTPHQRAMLRAGWQVQDVGPMSHAALDMATNAQYLWLERADFAAAVAHGMAKAEGLLARCDDARCEPQLRLRQEVSA